MNRFNLYGVVFGLVIAFLVISVGYKLSGFDFDDVVTVAESPDTGYAGGMGPQFDIMAIVGGGDELLSWTPASNEIILFGENGRRATIDLSDGKVVYVSDMTDKETVKAIMGVLEILKSM